MIKIYSKDNQIRCIAPTANGQQEKQLQGDNVLSLSFTLYEFIQLDVNDYATFLGERYWLLERYKPRMKNTKEWEYNLTLYGVESLVKRFLVINYTDNEDTPIFTLTAPASEHAKIILTSINKAIGRELFRLGEVKQTENLVIDYKGTYCNEALDLLAKAAKTEFWFEEGTTLNISRAQYGEPITLGYQKGLISLEREKADNVKFYTRLFPLGSTKNIDPDKYKHRRLQLPNGQKYVDKDTDKYGIVHHFEETAFADIYPRRIGVVSAVRSEERKNKEGKPFTVYYFKDKDLNFNPNEYKIGGYVMRVAFQEGSELAGQGTSEEHYFEVNYNDQAKEFEIITIFPSDDLQVPGGVLVPKTGDKYILSHLRMPDEYYPLAEQELLEAVKKYNDEHFVDNAVYKADTDHVWVEQNHAELYIGRRVRLENKEYFAPLGYRNSRITKVTRSIELPTLATIEISDAVPQGKIATMESSITDVRHYIGEVTNTIPDIIGSGDDTRPTEHNVFSAKRSLSEFLSKKHPDTAQAFIKFLVGIGFQNAAKIDGMGNAELLSIITEVLKSYDFNSTTESGFGVTKRKDGKYQLSITDLIVWGKAVFNELEIRKLSYVGGNMVFSSCGSKIKKVVPLDKNGEELSDRVEYFTSGGKLIPANRKFLSYTKKAFRKPSKAFASASKFIPANGGVLGCFDGNAATDAAAYRCYFHQDDGTMATTNLWEVGDQARCQTFNIKKGKYKGVSNRRYWRLVKKVGEDYIDLSATDCEEGSDVPQVGDALVQFGSRTNTDRMSLIYVVVNGDDAPAIIWYDGVNSYTLKSKRTAIVSPKEVVFNTRMFKLVNDNGEKVTAVAERGEWTQGEEYFYYDRVSYNGRLWLCIAPEGVAVTEEPSEHSDKWLLQVDKGDDNIKVDITVESGAIKNGKGSVTLYGTVYKGGKDITQNITPYRLKWTRMSSDSEADVAWNKAHAYIGRRITIQASEVKGGAYINYEFNK